MYLERDNLSALKRNRSLKKKIKLILLLIPMSMTSIFFANCNGGFETLPVEFGSTASINSSNNLPSGTNSALRRLTNDEINKSIALILEDSSLNVSSFLPKENFSPFDNNIKNQNPSLPLIQGIDNLAEDVTRRLMTDSSRRQRVVGCVNSAANDRLCMTDLVKRVGRMFFRRSLIASEQTSLVDFAMSQASLANSFDVGVETLLRTLIQHPIFLYRIENNATLTATEIATRLSFFLWGSGPDNQLIQMAESGQLNTIAQIKATALTMLKSPKAISQIQKFHSLWLGYAGLADDTLSTAMKREADAMVKRVLFDEAKPWKELFSTNQTTISSTLGSIYGISGLSSTATIVNLPMGRAGILSTAGFLSIVPKFSDTSPTMRGKFIRERLMCQTVPPPPPTVNIDAPPTVPAGQLDCKYNRYDSHRKSSSSCFACHQMMDPIGFGLERFDNKGKYREYDYNADGTLKTTCYIEGKGEIPNMGTFTGPAELSDLLINSQQIQRCLTKQMYHFAMGSELQNLGVQNFIKAEFDKSGLLTDLMIALVTSDLFLKK